MSKGWIGVDFDGTLAEYDKWQGPEHCGAPVAVMVARVKALLAEGFEVRVFTARIHPLDKRIEPDHSHWNTIVNVLNPAHVDAAKAVDAIRSWCKEHIGQELAITNVKDYGMIELYDDRCVQVVPNTGVLVGSSTRGL